MAPVPDARTAAGHSLGVVSPLDSPDPLRDLSVHPPGGVSDASHQLRALAALSGSLTDPLTPEEASAIVERHALAVLGATSAVVVTFGDFPPARVPRAEAGESAVADESEPAAPHELTLIHAIGVPDVALMPMPCGHAPAAPRCCRRGR